MIFPRRRLAVIALAFLAGFVPWKAAAEHAQHETCICDAAPSIPARNGASVPNASACWSVEDQGREWCDIIVESLASSTVTPLPPTAAEGNEQPTPAASFFRGRLHWFLDAYRAQGGENLMLSDLPQVEERMERLLGRHGELFGQCLEEFQKGLMGRGFHRESSDGVACQIGEETGWLRLRLAAGDVWVTYMLAPSSAL